MNKKLSNEKFNELLKEYSPKRIIGMHCNLKINLKVKQLDLLIKMKNEKEYGRRVKNEQCIAKTI